MPNSPPCGFKVHYYFFRRLRSGACVRADPAAVFAAFDDLGLRSTSDAALAARLLVFSFRAIMYFLLSSCSEVGCLIGWFFLKLQARYTYQRTSTQSLHIAEHRRRIADRLLDRLGAGGPDALHGAALLVEV